MNTITQPLARLPFVSAESSGKYDFWVATPTGDYDTDFATGLSFGEEMVAYARQNDDPLILQSVVKSIAKRGVGDIEMGFLQRVGRALISRQ